MGATAGSLAVRVSELEKMDVEARRPCECLPLFLSHPSAKVV